MTYDEAINAIEAMFPGYEAKIYDGGNYPLSDYPELEGLDTIGDEVEVLAGAVERSGGGLDWTIATFHLVMPYVEGDLPSWYDPAADPDPESTRGEYSTGDPNRVVLLHLGGPDAYLWSAARQRRAKIFDIGRPVED